MFRPDFEFDEDDTSTIGASASRRFRRLSWWDEPAEVIVVDDERKVALSHGDAGRDSLKESKRV